MIIKKLVCSVYDYKTQEVNILFSGVVEIDYFKNVYSCYLNNKKLTSDSVDGLLKKYLKVCKLGVKK